MLRFQRLINFFLIALLTCAVAFAQEQRSATKPQPASAPITVAASGANVRFTAVGAVERMRLEVFDASGSPVFDTGFKPGNVSDWGLRGSLGQQLPDSTYLCVVTVRELSGRLTFKQGSVLLQSGQASLALEGGGQPERMDPEESLSTRTATEPTAMAVVAHDGEAGQVTSTTGPLTFRTGDIFTARDKEQMRVTPEGRVGIGTKNPQATLDVAGVIRTGKGIRFPDGSVLTSAGTARGKTGKTSSAPDANGTDAEEPPTTDVSGTGTTGKLVKWTNGAAGTLGDSVVTESAGGNIGIGTATPNNKLHVVGKVELGATSGAGVNPTIVNPNNSANFALVQFYPASGTNVNTSFAVMPKGTGVTNNRAQFTVFNTDYIANSTNYEFASLRARGSDFVFGTGKSGSGVVRPLMFSAGFLTDNATNNNQFYLATDGNVGVGTNNPLAKLWVEHVSGGNTLVANNATTLGVAGSFFNTNASNPNHALGVLTTGTGRAGFFQISNSSNTTEALRSDTNSNVGRAAEFVNTNVATGLSAGVAVRALSSGGVAADAHPLGNFYPAAGEFVGATGVIGATSSTSSGGSGVTGVVGSSGDAASVGVRGHNFGLGYGGIVKIDNASNSSPALLASTNGTGVAASFYGTGPSSQGVFISSGSGQKGLEVNRGRIILPWTSLSDGDTIPSDVAVVDVLDNGGATKPTVALPASAENGTMIFVGTSDVDGAEITGASGGTHTITVNESRRFTRVGAAWKTEI